METNSIVTQDKLGAVSQADAWPIRFGLWYDFGNPPPWSRPNESLYAETLDQAVYAEQLGYRSAWLTEHHFVDGGYAVSPLVIAAAIAARTQRMRIGTSVMLMPLHDPVRLAEDAMSLAILSGGRFDLGVGIGYRDLEFEAFGRKLSHRPSLIEEAVEIVKRAFKGTSIGFEGKRFKYPDVRVSPVAEHPPRMLVGGMSEPAIDRAARIADGFLAMQSDHIGMYVDALERHGKDVSATSIHLGSWVVIDDDPERTWARIGDHAVHQVNQYIDWGGFGPPEDVPRFPDRDALLASGTYQLWDGPTAVRELLLLLRQYPQIEDFFTWAQLPGEPVESGTSRLEYFMSEVAPHVGAALQQERIESGLKSRGLHRL